MRTSRSSGATGGRASGWSESVLEPTFSEIAVLIAGRDIRCLAAATLASYHQAIVADQSDDRFNFHLWQTIKNSIKMKFAVYAFMNWFCTTVVLRFLCCCSSPLDSMSARFMQSQPDRREREYGRNGRTFRRAFPCGAKRSMKMAENIFMIHFINYDNKSNEEKWAQLFLAPCLLRFRLRLRFLFCARVNEF